MANQSIIKLGAQRDTNTNPESRGLKRTERFWNRVAASYAERPVPDPVAYEHKLEITREFLSPCSEVLELGCGTGTTALKHAPHVRHIRATDISAEMLGIARTKAADEGVENVDFVRADASTAYPHGVQFDAILALSLLHLLPDWQGD